MMHLDDLVAELSAQWGLSVNVDAVRHGYSGVVMSALREGEPFALKLAWPPARTRVEAAGLMEWNGRGAVQLVAHDADRGALLLEQLDASCSLASLPLNEAAVIAGQLIRTLAVSPDGQFQTVAESARAIAESNRYQQSESAVSGRLRDVAADLARSLAGDDQELLVHADLHYNNILASSRDDDRWVAIDPKPLIGAPERSLGELLWTRVDELHTPAEICRLLEVLIASGGLNRDLALAWAFVRVIDYWLWASGVGLTVDPVRCERVAQAIEPLLP